MDTLRAMKVFASVVDSGSFSAAARELGVRQSTVSKAVAALEERLGVRLLQRSSAGMSLTEVGEEYLGRVRSVLDLAEDADSTARRHGSVLEGRIKIGASVAFGKRKLVAPVLDFLSQHPGLGVELLLSDADADLVTEGVDVAIRIGVLPDSALIARRIARSPRVTVASPAYLAAREEPQHPSELSQHDCVLYTRLRRGRRWVFEREGESFEVLVDGRLRTDSSEVARDAVIAGFGIGYFPLWLCSDALVGGRLKEVLPRYRPELLPVQAVFPEKRYVARRTRLLVEHLEEAFRHDADLVADKNSGTGQPRR